MPNRRSCGAKLTSNVKKYFRIDREVKRVDGSQSFVVIANNVDEAAKLLKEGVGEFVGEAVEVVGLEEISINDIYEVSAKEYSSDK